MHALVADPDRTPAITLDTDYPDPAPPPGEVLIRVDLAGVCATDLEVARGYMQYRGVLGHEFVGTVVAGDDQLVGQRIVGDINCACGACPSCRAGRENHCPNRTVLGIVGRDGAFAEQLTLPAANCHTLPDSVSNEQAVFVEPLAAAAHVLDAADFSARQRVAVLGTGRLGLLVGLVLAGAPCELTMLGRNAHSLDVARRLGLSAEDVRDLPAEPTQDVVVDCTGHVDGFRRAIQLCRPMGTLVLKSTFAEQPRIDLAPIVINELHIVGSRCGDFERAIALLTSGRIDVAPLVSATYPLRAGSAAIEAAASKENIKVLITPGAA